MEDSTNARIPEEPSTLVILVIDEVACPATLVEFASAVYGNVYRRPGPKWVERSDIRQSIGPEF
ncbi:uncharacterized protein PGTG_20688 [Puccinia graminis f. sp. tritici CRL 75-36-700-3]|uniref:Uncharacterized protein n=1 Tax=Puccinia graminis f. sp. tritici (strain CRL 75-36-700-3 / race SCCL) TaxID=418459 RepID=H6QPE3_PUCGT|nr:uncharacterized protein PGTG_20688 [Puccinia graminis f. sp. tritici CRL 75-36-700-3]EHS63594.1 hypothetical protein PGTG_20688 [Puccinia graminis f. sp. tritici CRL 75-36-700-3]